MAKKVRPVITHEALVYGDSFRYAAQDERIPRYYIVVEARSPNCLVKDVQCKIQEGWIPKGGFSADAERYWQAMIKY